MNILLLTIFWILYIATFCVFKLGSIKKKHELPCLIIGNVFGISGTGVLMLLYRTMNVHIALGLALGVGFVFAQFALSLLFKNKLSKLQYIGAITIAAGIFMLTMGGTV
jgi:multidrug transporter EmrE-like cation transporter